MARKTSESASAAPTGVTRWSSTQNKRPAPQKADDGPPAKHTRAASQPQAPQIEDAPVSTVSVDLSLLTPAQRATIMQMAQIRSNEPMGGTTTQPENPPTAKGRKGSKVKGKGKGTQEAQDRGA